MTAGPNEPQRTPDASGWLAGMMIISSVVLVTAVGAALGALVGLTVPLALAAAPIGLVLGFYAVWLRFFKRA